MHTNAPADSLGQDFVSGSALRRRDLVGAAIFGALPTLAAAGATAATDPTRAEEPADPQARIAEFEQRLAALQLQADRTAARGSVENVFARYQYLHTTFQDLRIIDELWVKRGTPGISAQYTNSGIYNTWDSVMAYHRNRPSPFGKLLVHFNTSPVIEVAGDGRSAKGVWIVAGVESGLSDPEMAKKAPASFFEPGEVDGKKVWAHWIQVRYHLDFLKQDDEWRIWHFRCVELSRAPFSRNWISFAAELEANAATAKYHNDLAYFGDDGKPVFMPPVDAPPKNLAYGYRTDHATKLEPPLPAPYRTMSETFEY